MEIVRENIVRHKILDVTQVIEESSLFEMDEHDIKEDKFMSNETIGANESILVFQSINLNSMVERYCYIKISTHYAADGMTKALVVEKIVTDENLINMILFEAIFRILLQNESNSTMNRIFVGKVNACLSGEISSVVQKISQHVYNLYDSYTSPLVTTHYVKNDFMLLPGI